MTVGKRGRQGGDAPSIRSRLVWLVLASIVPAALATFLLIYKLYQHERGQLHYDLLLTARALSLVVDRDLASSTRGLQALATSPHLDTGDLAAFHRQATEAAKAFGSLNVVLSDESGQQIVNTLQPFGAPLPRHGDPRQLRRVLESGQPSVSNLFLGGVLRSPLIAVEIPVRRGGRIAYVMSAGILPERLGQILAEQRLPPAWSAAILDLGGTIVARSRERERFVGQKGAPDLLRAMSKAAEGMEGGTSLDGEQVIRGFSRSPVSGWTVVVGVPETAVRAQLRQSVALVGLGALSFLAGGLALAWLFARRIGRSIRGLSPAVLALGSGEPVAVPSLGLKEADQVGAVLAEAGGLLRQRTEERERAERIAATQNRLLEMIATGASLPDILASLTRAIEALEPDMLAAVRLLDDAGAHLRYASAPSLPEAYVRQTERVPVGEGSASCGTAAFRRRQVIVEDIATDPLWSTMKEPALAHGLRACWSTPILDAGGFVLGTFAVFYRTARQPPPAHQDLVRMATHVAAIAIARDREEASLRESRADLSRAQAVGQIGSWRLDVRHNELSWSEENWHIFGVPRGTALTYEIFLGTVHPEDRAFVDARWSAALRGEPYDIEHRIVVGDAVKWVRERAELEFDADGRLLGGFGTTQDITERKHADQALRQLNARLETLLAERTQVAEERASQLRDLAAELTRAEQRERHDLAEVLHDHLQPLLVGCRLKLGLVDGDTPVEKVRRTVAEAEKHIGEAQQIARSLSVELNPPVLETEGLGAALHWLCRWTRTTQGLEVEAGIDPHAEPHNATTRILLFKAVRELLLNVAKHAQASTVSLTMSRTADDQVRITVTDGGTGFEAGEWSESDRAMRGSGLSTIKRRLGMIGGSFAVDSLPGKGTTSTLQAPIDTAASAATARPAAGGERRAEPSRAEDAQATAGRRIRVVLAEDHQMLRQSLAATLREQPDIEVVGETGDGLAAVELAHELRPDLVIMDINLPRLNGVEATRRITREVPGVAVIGLSAYEEAAVAAGMRAAGASASLSKAVALPALLDAIRRHAAAAASRIMVH